MKCTDVEQRWAACEGGRVSPEDEARLREHMDRCGHCRRADAELRRLEFALEELAADEIEAPPFFQTRVMARVGEVRLPARRFWPSFLTSRRLLAVSTACLAFFAGLLARELHRVNQWAGGSGLQEVVLQLDAPEAQQVSLAGDFNGWGGEKGLVRAERRDGRWVFRVRLEPGRYQYAFVVDGKKWLPDPGATGIIPDGFGGTDSVLYVPGKPSGRRRSL